MRVVTVVFCYTGALLCCLPACNSSTTCKVKLDRNVYAFPANIFSDRTSSENKYRFSFKIDIKRDEQSKLCNDIEWNAAILKFLINSTTAHIKLPYHLKNLIHRQYTYPLTHLLNFTISASSVFESYNGSLQFGEGYVYFTPMFQVEPKVCKMSTTETCSVKVNVQQDNAPAVNFKTLLDGLAHTSTNSNLHRNELSSSLVELEYDMEYNSSSKIMVDIEVMDSDDFVTNPDRFEYCVVGVPNITLSAVLLSGTRHSGITSETYHIPLATDVDVSQSDNAWWESNSTRVNETLVNVRFAFAVSALWSATKAVLSQQNKTSKLSHSANSDVIVNITLQVTATSGRTNPQRRNATFILVLYCKQAILAASTQVTTADELSSAAESTPVPTEDKLSSAAATTPVTTEDKLSIASASTPVPTEVKLSSHAASTPVPTKDKRFFTSASFSQPISHKVTTALDEKSVTTFVVAVLLVGFTLCGIVLFIVLLELYNVICDKPLLLLRL